MGDVEIVSGNSIIELNPHGKVVKTSLINQRMVKSQDKYHS